MSTEASANIDAVLSPSESDVSTSVAHTEDNSTSSVDTNSASNTEGSEPSTLLDFVTKAVPDLELSDESDDLLSETGAEETAKAGTGKQEADQTQNGAADGKPDAPADGTDEDADKDDGSDTSLEISSKEFQHMNSKTRRKVRALQERAALAGQLEVPARAAESLNTYLRQNNIDNDSFNTLLSVGAALQRGDFKTFLESITPFVQLAQEQLGVVLPHDLHAQVMSGQMTEEGARDVQRQRLALMQRNETLSRQAQQEARQRQETELSLHQQNAATIASTVSSWENTVRASDPDYARKAEAMKDITRSLIAERGAPRTPQEAVAMAQEAYNRVNDFAKQFAPAPKPTANVPSGIRSNSGRAPEPRSLEEAVLSGLRAAQ